MMRSIAIGCAAVLLLGLASTAVLARGGHGGSMGGSGGHWSGGGGHWSGGAAHWSGGGRWNGAFVHSGGIRHVAFFHGGRFHHHRRFFFGSGFAYADTGCWRWWPTSWGWRRVWVCGNPYWGYF